MKRNIRFRAACLAAALMCGAAWMQGCAIKAADRDGSESTADSAGSAAEESSAADTTAPLSLEFSVPDAFEPDKFESDENGDADSSTEDEFIMVRADTGKAEYAEASKTLERYLEAMKAGDTETVLEIMDLNRSARDYLLMLGTIATAEDPDAAVKLQADTLRENVTKQVGMFQDYSVQFPYEMPNYMKRCEEAAPELAEMDSRLEEVRAQAAPEEAAELQRAEAMVELIHRQYGIDMIYVIQCQMHYTDFGGTEWMCLVCRDGKWAVDTTFFGPMVLGKIKKDIVNEANDMAKHIYNAVQSALTDMSAEGILDASLDDTYDMKGGDFANLSKPAETDSAEGKRQYFYYKVAAYYGEITEINVIMFSVTNSSCDGVALQNGIINLPQETKPVIYGSYPNLMKPNAWGIGSVSAALEYAKKQS